MTVRGNDTKFVNNNNKEVYYWDDFTHLCRHSLNTLIQNSVVLIFSGIREKCSFNFSDFSGNPETFFSFPSFSGPNLKMLCKIAVIQHSLDQSGLPHDIRSDKLTHLSIKYSLYTQFAFYCYSDCTELGITNYSFFSHCLFKIKSRESSILLHNQQINAWSFLQQYVFVA